MVLKMKLLFMMVFGLFMMNVDCVEQKCGEFGNVNWLENTYNKGAKTYYYCGIHNANLTEESKTVSTNTQLNKRSNADVTLVWYYPNKIVKFISNSLFTTFINLEYFYIDENNEFEVLKPEFLTNAINLKNFYINNNGVKVLEAKLFVRAANLEHINFRRNKIESVHKLAFYGLPNLKGVYLHANKIKSLHPSTFSFITKLDILDFSANTCVDKEFNQANQKASEVEAKIKGSCAYNLFPDELEEAEKIAELQRISIIVDEKLKEQEKKW